MIKINQNKGNKKNSSWLKKILDSNIFSSSIRQNIIAVIIYFAFFLIILNLINLQIFQHSNKDKFVHNIVYNESDELQKRGTIFDRNNNVLAMSIKTYSIALDSKMMNDLQTIKNLLEKYNIELSSSNYKSIKAGKMYIPIKTDIPANVIINLKSDINNSRKQTKNEIKSLKRSLKKYKKNKEKQEEIKNKIKELKKDNFVCLKIESRYKRFYPEQMLASHVIGKTNASESGILGIEKLCNNRLKGKNIKRQKYKINNGKNIILDSFEEDNSNELNNVILTIDRKIQFIVEKELKVGLEKTNSKRAVAIVQNPHNGEILAMASLPTYNPNEPVLNQEYLRNGAISTVAEPGSTFKIVVLSSVIEEKLFNLSDRINCENGFFKYAGKPITDHEKQKIITVQQILERSSNVGTAKLAIELGAEKFYKYILNFGFNSPTGIDLTGEEKGMLAPVKKWSKRSLPTLSFGQELSTTPIQTISAYSAIANGGLLIKPKIIKSIGNEKYEDVHVVRRVISEDTAYRIRQALKGVVENGTGKSAKIRGYSVGGKTGTAQKYDQKEKKYSTKHYMASFCGMIPALNPEIVILVIYDEPDGDYYASSVTAPVFAKIAQQVADYLKIESDIKIKNIGAKK